MYEYSYGFSAPTNSVPVHWLGGLLALAEYVSTLARQLLRARPWDFHIAVQLQRLIHLDWVNNQNKTGTGRKAITRTNQRAPPANRRLDFYALTLSIVIARADRFYHTILWCSNSPISLSPGLECSNKLWWSWLTLCWREWLVEDAQSWVCGLL